MQDSGADSLIVDLEDFTPPARRDEARRNLAGLIARWRDAGRITVVRIDALTGHGPADLAAAMPARPDVIARPRASSAVRLQRHRTPCARPAAPVGNRARNTVLCR